MQLEEQKKQLEEQRRQLEEHKRGLDSKSRQLEEKEKSIADADQKLKKRKEKLDQLEAQLQKGAGARGGNAEVQKRMMELEQQVEAHQKELEKSKEDAQRSQVEMERLLQLVQMSQEEQNAKEKTIRDLQEALKNAQAKLRSQQASAQMERREEVEMQDKAVETIQNISSKNASEVMEDAEEEKTGGFDDKVSEIQKLKEELKKRGQKVSELEKEIGTLETALQENANIAELEELVVVVRQKDDRIEELEEALRESVRITAEREKVLHQESTRRKQIMEKVGKLEQRLLSLQTAHALRCSSCRPLVGRLQELEQRLGSLTAERRQHLQDLSRMKQEALEAALSEKDAHLALLEVSGIRTARQAEEAEQLRADRKRLMEKLREENEQSVRLLQEYSLPDVEQFTSSVTNLIEAEDIEKETTTSNHNGHPHQEEEIDQDSLEPLSPDSTLGM